MKFQITNESTVVGAEEFADAVAACAAQNHEDFAPAHGLAPAAFEYGGAPDPDAYKAHVVDDSTSPGALGYHDNDEQGKPRIFIFAKTAKQDGMTVSSVLSHEICEAHLDPNCVLWSMTPDNKLRAYEACDAVENDSYTKKVGGKDITVSNFLTPAYFTDTPINGVKTDFMDTLKGQIAPARTPGGYDIVVDSAGQPSQEFSEHMTRMSAARREMKTSKYSRTSRRTARAVKGAI